MAGILLWLNLAVLSLFMGMIASANACIVSENLFLLVFARTTFTGLLLISLAMWSRVKKLSSESIWSRPHFSGATLAQFCYVAAQSGKFAFFIKYMTTQPPVPASNPAASTLASVGFACFLVARFIGAGLVEKFSAHMVLGIYGAVNALLCACVMLRLGWASTVCVFLAYFLMSILFPTIFALGISGLGDGAKKASSFIVMATMGGAIMPKLIGRIADISNVSLSFIVPLCCFLRVAAYGFFWSKLVGSPR
jgi:FHS family L-fucose permease-like MFS transporter